MKRAIVLFLGSAPFLLMGIGCGQSAYSFHPERTQAELIENAKKEIPALRDFIGFYPTAGVGVYSENFKKGTTSVQSIQILYDRYEMSLTVDFEVDRKLHAFSSRPASIALVEIVSIEDLPAGRYRETYGKTFRITPEQWKKVLEAGGQFSVLGLEIKTNQPVDGIEKVKTYLRRKYSP
jgi:hypothetical protein